MSCSTFMCDPWTQSFGVNQKYKPQDLHLVDFTVLLQLLSFHGCLPWFLQCFCEVLMNVCVSYNVVLSCTTKTFLFQLIS